jgi:LPXTG-site transpeptidase (sortase) family protein
MVPVTTWQTEAHLAQALQISPVKAFMKEFGLFIGIFATVFVLSIVFVNANLLYHTVKGAFMGVQAADYTFTSQSTQTQTAVAEKDTHEANLEIDALVRQDRELFVGAQEKTETQLKQKEYAFSYSLVPPGNRIFIPAIGIDAPIIDITAASESKIKHGDFNQELYSWVVKYPSTPEPGSHGNTLIFGHTSFYRWKQNPYGEIFAKIYQLNTGDEIKVARQGQMYTYEIIASIVTSPNKVDAEYLKYTDGEYITLMWCYPVGSDSRRWLIIAKRKH